MRAWGPCALLAMIGACAQPAPRQALVELVIERALLSSLSTVEVSALDADGGTRGGAARLDLRAPYVRDGRVSFGAVPAADGRLMLRFQGFDAEDDLLLEQTLESRTQGKGITKLSMVLRADCLGQIHCSAAPDPCTEQGADGCDAGVPAAGDCLLETVLDCGECGNACNMSHVLLSSCVDGKCAGSCQAGWGACDAEIGSEGCTTPLLTDPLHCGRCDLRCPYEACVAGRCERSCDGAVFSGTPRYSAAQPPNRMVGVKVVVEERGVLAGLGVHVDRGSEVPDTRFRMALYTHDEASGRPGQLVDQAAETSVHALGRAWSGALSDCGGQGLEMRVPNRVVVEPGEYWLFMIASASLQYSTRPVQVSGFISQDDVDYASLLQLPTQPSDLAPLRERRTNEPEVYLVRTPLP